MPKFYVTFGSQYSREEHPRFDWADPDGWVTIDAASEMRAREAAMALLGRAWAMIYDEREFFGDDDEAHKAMYPAGEIIEVTVP